MPENPIKTRAKELGLSTHAIAKIVGLSQPVVLRHIHGQRRLAADSMDRYHYRLQIPYDKMRAWNRHLKPLD